MIARPASHAVEVLETRIAPATLFATDLNNNLITVDSAAPGEILSTTPIVGLGTSERIEGIDFRPATGQIYLLGVTNPDAGTDTARLYTVNIDTGQLTQLGVPIGGLADGAACGFDFNPAADRIRVVNTSDQSFRLNPNDGSLAGTDTNLADAANDESIYAVAYDRSFDGANATTLFGIDFAGNSLVRIGGVDGVPSPNGGVVTRIGTLGFTANNERGGFDIDPQSGAAFAALNDNGVNSLYTINLGTGAATLVGAIGDGTQILSAFTIAPQFVKMVNNTTATFTDPEGDLITVKVSKGTLEASDFIVATKANGRLQLRALNFSDDAQEFAGANVSITAKPTAKGGDSFVAVGYINATGVDLGSVTVKGDLGQIDAGNTATNTAPALKALTVHSMGLLGLTSQVPVGSSLTSNIAGPLGKFVIKTDLRAATIAVAGLTPEESNLGSLFIGRNLIGAGSGDGVPGGGITATGNIGAVTVLGSVVGRDAADSGQIDADGTMGKIVIRGSVIGGSVSNSGVVQSGGNMGAVFIGGSVVGGTDDHTGNVFSNDSIASVTVRGSIIGGTVTTPGLDLDSGLIYALGATIGPVKIGGSLYGGNGEYSGSLFASGRITSVSIAGSLIGGPGGQSGGIQASSGVGALTVGGDMIGAGGFASGSLFVAGVSASGNITIAGSVVGGDSFNGILSGGRLGAVKIGGDLRSESALVSVSAAGAIDPENAADALAIKSLSVRGDVMNARVFAGFHFAAIPTNADAQIGAVKVHGNWIASSLAAGVGPGGDGRFGTADDTLAPEGGSDAIFSRIASVVIKGMAIGSPGLGDDFGFVAQQIGKFKVGATIFPLTSGTDNPLSTDPRFLVGPTGDLRIHEV